MATERSNRRCFIVSASRLQIGHWACTFICLPVRIARQGMAPRRALHTKIFTFEGQRSVQTVPHVQLESEAPTLAFDNLCPNWYSHSAWYAHRTKNVPFCWDSKPRKHPFHMLGEGSPKSFEHLTFYSSKYKVNHEQVNHNLKYLEYLYPVATHVHRSNI